MTKRRLIDDCFLHDKDRLQHAQATEILKIRLTGLTDIETVSLADVSGRILAENITASRNIPNHDNSAVDGYAYRSADFDVTGGSFEVSQRIAAGQLANQSLAPLTATRIFTGAAMPLGADTVAMQEDCELTSAGEKQTVTIPKGLKFGANRRLAGEDVGTGEVVAKAGDTAGPAQIAAIASTGTDECHVYTTLKVIIFSTGNEIVETGNELKRGQVYDANRPLFKSMMKTLPVAITDGGVLSDNSHEVKQRLLEASNTHDVIITSGGASRGEEDHIVTALDELGHRHMWQLAIKPGRPMTFGQIGDVIVFGMPGNPVAGFVCFLLYVHSALNVLAGGYWKEPQRFPLPVGFSIPNKKPDRREYWRGWIDQSNGFQVLKKFDRDGSGLISGLTAATGLIEVPEDTTQIDEGDILNFIPFSQFGF